MPRKPETDLQNQIRLALAYRQDLRLFRNNVGCLPNGRGGYIRYGLCDGSGDLIGIKCVELRCHCGAVIPAGVFVSMEVKTRDGRSSEEQIAFADMVRRLNGIAGVVRSAEEAEDLIETKLW